MRYRLVAGVRQMPHPSCWRSAYGNRRTPDAGGWCTVNALLSVGDWCTANTVPSVFLGLFSPSGFIVWCSRDHRRRYRKSWRHIFISLNGSRQSTIVVLACRSRATWKENKNSWMVNLHCDFICQRVQCEVAAGTRGGSPAGYFGIFRKGIRGGTADTNTTV